MTRPRGGYIGHTPTTSALAAHGVWTLREAEASKRAGVWEFATDPYFANVVLLLPMDGTGNTFVDASAVPKTITANGNATQSATQSKWGGKSGLFDGSGDWLSIANHPGLNLSTAAAWVIEGWIYPLAIQQYIALVSKRSFSNPTSYYVHFGNGYLSFWNGSSNLVGSTQGQINEWSHFAAAYSAGWIRLYWNGSLVGSASMSINEIDVPVTVGRHFSSVEEVFNGYIDDLRITKGSDRGYTGATIPVPTTAFPTL